ncbi:MAG: ABC transporter permease [Acidimicrobiales bacterium]|nr:ABC transporter permease [Acidimicrobiales bacterium]
MPAGLDRGARAVAAQEVRDGLRGRRQLAIRAVLPVLLFAVVLVTAIATRGVDQTEEPYRVAVEGDLSGAREALALLPADAVIIEPVDDAAVAVAGGATIGLVVPDGLDAARARGEPAVIEIQRSVGASRARAATSLVVGVFGDADLAMVKASARDAGIDANVGVAAFDQVDVQLTERGTRELSGGLAPALLTLQAALLVSASATQLLSRQRRGLLTAQLLLPVSRWQLSLAKGAASLVLGMVAGAPVLVVVLGIVGVINATRSGVVAALVGVLACVVASLALSALAAALGLAVGVRARSQEQISLASMVVVVGFAVVAAVVALGEHRVFEVLAVVPLVGVVSTLRDVLAGEGSVVLFVVGVASTLLAAAAIVWRTSRHVDAERLVLRSAG